MKIKKKKNSTRPIHKITVVVSLMKYYGIPFEPPNTPLVKNPNEDIGYSRKYVKLHPGKTKKKNFIFYF